MKYKIILLLLFSNFYVCIIAQKITNYQLEQIDSLISISEFDKAKNIVDSLFIIADKKDLKNIAYLFIQLSIIYEHKGDYAQSIQAAISLIELSKEIDFYEEEFRAHLQIALIYELNKDWKNCLIYLENAKKLAKNHHLEALYSQYCIRFASYLRFNNQQDSALFYTEKGFDLALKYNNKRDLVDSYLLFAALYRNNAHLSIDYKKKAAKEFILKKEYNTSTDMYNSIAQDYLYLQNIEQAFLFSDSVFILNKKYNIPNSEAHYLMRSNIHKSINNIDSAYYYYTLFHQAYSTNLESIQSIKILEITEKYQNEKQEEIIKIQHQRLILLIIIVIFIGFTAILLIQKNGKIKANNTVIASQLQEVSKLLEQKKLLNSELQHRVKNNLQHIISILDLQKESLNFNNIDEVIRENQNRIHSMALLQKKINTLENINEINLEKYITELMELIKDSYYNKYKTIDININCSIEKISIEKALPIGLILVELLSNSIKHAFHDKLHGIITINLEKDYIQHNNILIYKDNGVGFNFNSSYNKGLGLEIIKGLIDQLNAKITTPQTSGFELVIYFK